MATSEFSPFTGETTAPTIPQSPPLPWDTRRLRANSKAEATARPVPRNLLELGLAHGHGADELEERLQHADAAKRQADRTTGDRELSDQVSRMAAPDVCADEQADSTPSLTDQGPPAEQPSPQAIVALATEIQTIRRTRSELAAEFEGLEQQENSLKAELSRLLGTGAHG